MKRRILFTFSLLMAISVLIISTAVIYLIYDKNLQDIAAYEQIEKEKLKTQLKNLNDIPYELIQHNYQLLEKDSFLIAYIKKEFLLKDSTQQEKNEAELLVKYQKAARERFLNTMLEEIANIRYDNGKGYFWITDNTLPFPKMIMHPVRPQYNGLVMNDAKYNTEKGTQKNIYQARAEIANTQGSGFIEYLINKPGKEEFETKVSYSKLFQPLNWIISTGLYADQIQAAVEEKRSENTRQVWRIIFTILVISLVILGVFMFLVERFSDQMVRAIQAVRDRLKNLALGKKVSKLKVDQKHEIKEMTESLNSLVEGLGSYTRFAREVGDGKLDSPFEALSEEDILGNALLNMGESLKQSAAEEEQRKWVAEKTASFGEVLRINNSDLQVLGEYVLDFLSTQLAINQGALYIVKEDDNEADQAVIELFACYAYDRKKYLKMQINPGDGLVGQCYLERKMIRLIDVPDDYPNIKSGLGSSTPTEVLILPLNDNNQSECYGILELATTRNLKDIEREFIVNVCGSLASTINAVRTNERTLYLLQKSQNMTEELKAQEEELRQNQEEMQASQEEMTRRYNQILEDYNKAKEENERLKEQLGTPKNGVEKNIPKS